MPFKSIEEGGNRGRECPFMWCVAKDISLSLFYLPQAKMMPYLTTEQLESRNGSKPQCGQLKTINSTLDWFQVQRSTTYNILGIPFNVASHQQSPWLWVLMIAVFSLCFHLCLQRWMHGHCPVQNNSGASCPAEQTMVGQSSTGNLFIISASL